MIRFESVPDELARICEQTDGFGADFVATVSPLLGVRAPPGLATHVCGAGSVAVERTSWPRCRRFWGRARHRLTD
ncbi:MAG: hypothetical protein AB1758_31095, partial [Candidatus Eremiobacterota bacterium]